MSICTLFVATLTIPQMRSLLCFVALSSSLAIAAGSRNSSLAQACIPSLPKVICINQYAAAMPHPFFRDFSNGTNSPPFGSTAVSEDMSFNLVSKADFLVFDQKRGLDILGTKPSYEYVFRVSDAVHEAPVYVPSQNKIYLSSLEPAFLPQLVIDLNRDPPTLSEYISDPPVYAANGGMFHDGLVYWAVSGSNKSIGGIEQRPGIRTLDPSMNKTVTLLNNYFGWYFNTVDDLVIHPNGDVWFTDPGKSLTWTWGYVLLNIGLPRLLVVR